MAELAPGEILVVETADCFNGQIHESGQKLDAIDMGRVNPATGPFYITGAEPGDALEVEILEIKTSERGVMVAAPGLGVLGAEIENPVTKVVQLSGSNVTLAEGISMPVQPMIGVIGVAPKGEAVGCGSPGVHGGNLDTKEIQPGSKVLLPVFHPGALLALGDVHALMGDGEISGTGIETGAEVKIRVQVKKQLNLEGPRVETPEGTYFIASAETLEAAIHAVARVGVEFIQDNTGLSFPESYMLAGAGCQLRISQVVNPLFTVKLFVPHFLQVLQE